MTQTKNESGVWIDLRRNNTITNDPCALCGSRCDPCGLDFFLRDSDALVCVSCARKHAPQLIEALQAAAANAPLIHNDDVEVEHTLHEASCAIHHHAVGVPCDCGAVSWFEIMPREAYEAMLPLAGATEATGPKMADSDFPF